MAGAVIGGALAREGRGRGQRLIDGGDSNVPFLETKIALARYFAAAEIPAAVARGRAARHSNPVVAAMTSDRLE